VYRCAQAWLPPTPPRRCHRCRPQASPTVTGLGACRVTIDNIKGNIKSLPYWQCAAPNQLSWQHALCERYLCRYLCVRVQRVGAVEAQRSLLSRDGVAIEHGIELLCSSGPTYSGRNIWRQYQDRGVPSVPAARIALRVASAATAATMAAVSACYRDDARFRAQASRRGVQATAPATATRRSSRVPLSAHVRARPDRHSRARADVVAARCRDGARTRL